MAVPVEIVHRRAERAERGRMTCSLSLPPSPRSNHESRPMLLPYMLNQVGVAIGVEIREAGVSGAGDA